MDGNDDEQLTQKEQEDAFNLFYDKYVDFMITHTCPFSLQPEDLFLSSVDQSKVDKSMEQFLERIKDVIHVNVAWLFGHFHADRIERPHVEQFYRDIEELSTIAERWKRYNKTGNLDWWLAKSQNFWMGR